MAEWPTPNAEQQLAFLHNLQRLFEEGDFTSTYKYALLLALAELAIESGCDSGASLSLPLTRIAEKFAEFYWPQAAPYSSGIDTDATGVLIQNLGQQAAVIRHLCELRSTGPTTLPQARKSPNWDRAIRGISTVVRNMPVRYLQNIAGSTTVFLYDPQVVSGIVVLLPGVAFNLRRFQGFVQQLVRAGWVNHIRSNHRNAPLIGQAADLESFMFGTPRAMLSGVARVLKQMQGNRCFFCLETLNDAAAVDHFIPWSRYPRDTALNFVLAHASCNNDKRELLAGRPHLDRWLQRNRQEGDAIAGELQEFGFLPEPGVTTMVARWAYQQGVSAGSRVWLSKGRTEAISPDMSLAFG